MDAERMKLVRTNLLELVGDVRTAALELSKRVASDVVLPMVSAFAEEATPEVDAARFDLNVQTMKAGRMQRLVALFWQAQRLGPFPGELEVLERRVRSYAREQGVFVTMADEEIEQR